MQTETTSHILLVEDDEDDRILIREAFADVEANVDLQAVDDGEALMQYLRCEGPYGHVSLPDLILMDLRMPRMDGLECLKEIRQDPRYRFVPIIVLTTSAAERDRRQAYELGANSYIVKPVSYEALVEMAARLCNYWFNIVTLPRPAMHGR